MTPSDCLRKKDASPQSSAGFPTSSSVCELFSCEKFHTIFQIVQARSSPGHKAELLKAMLARAASDEEVVGHFPNRQSLHIKLGGIPGRLAPNGFDAEATCHLDQRIQHARANALHFATGWTDGVRVRRRKIKEDMMTPRSSAKTESKNRRRLVPCGTSQHHKHNLGTGVFLNRAPNLLQRRRCPTNRPVGFPTFVCQLAVFKCVLNVRIIVQMFGRAPTTQRYQVVLRSEYEFNGQGLAADSHAKIHGGDLITEAPPNGNTLRTLSLRLMTSRGRMSRSP